MTTCRGVFILWSKCKGGSPKDTLYFDPFDVGDCYDPDAAMNTQSIVRRAARINCRFVSILTLIDNGYVLESCYVIEAGKLKALEKLEES